MIRQLFGRPGLNPARIIATLLLAVAASTAFAQGAPSLADNAPDRHIVVPGDTLWGIAGKFIKEPWRWPEIWRLNKEQVKNPHRIYPGDVIVLVRGEDGNPQLKIAKPIKLEPRQYTEAVKDEISTIPQHMIEPFLSRPLIVEANELENEARIVATQEGRVYLGNGDKAFVANVRSPAEMWQIYRPGAPMADPNTKEILGYEAFYLGTARMVQPGEPAVMEMVNTKQEVGKFDRLMPAEKPPLLTYAPHKPDAKVEARIISVYGGVGTGGRHSVIAISRGAKDGLEVGHVLALYRSAQNYVQRNEKGEKEEVSLPAQRYGLVLVFRTFDRVSYALVMDSAIPLSLADTLRNP
ncbi:MAG TPA: LysM domain-containing protein [Azospira sp.]|nr:LysM domain-containing protein [Azospira sp.]